MESSSLEIAEKIENGIIKSVTLAKIACILNDDDILDEALKIAKKMDLLHYSETLSKIAVELVKAGRFDDALNIANEVVEERFRLEALETIVSYLSDAKRFDKALEIAKRLRYRSQRALSNLSVKLAMEGDLEKSIEVAKMVREKSWKAETLAKLAYEFYNTNKPYEELFSKALNIARSINDKAIRSRTLLRIAIEQAKAKKDYRAILDEGLRIEKNDIDILNLSKSLVEIDEVDAALRAIEFIKEKYWKVEAMAILASIFRKTEYDLFEKAKELAMDIGSKELICEALSRIAVEMAKSGKSYDDVFEAVIERAEGLDEFSKSKVLTNVVIDVLEVGDVGRAIKVSNKITDEIYQSEALFYITSKLVKNGEIDKALEIAEKISDVYWRSRALSEIAVGLAKNPVSYK
ncbi:hypothetical protein DRO97_03925 [Archaeoglobales archaeon]|nr:MAG: hypothetical protein DRO97_03925 [Archaeoglobales archaeon]